MNLIDILDIFKIRKFNISTFKSYFKIFKLIFTSFNKDIICKAYSKILLKYLKITKTNNIILIYY